MSATMEREPAFVTAMANDLLSKSKGGVIRAKYIGKYNNQRLVKEALDRRGYKPKGQIIGCKVTDYINRDAQKEAKHIERKRLERLTRTCKSCGVKKTLHGNFYQNGRKYYQHKCTECCKKAKTL